MKADVCLCRELRRTYHHQGSLMGPLDSVNLTPLMGRTSDGAHERSIRGQGGLIDEPVAMDHPDLARQNIREVAGKLSNPIGRVAYGKDRCCASNDSSWPLRNPHLCSKFVLRSEHRAEFICGSLLS